MRTSIRKILFKHLRELLSMKFHLKGLIQFYKSHPIWYLRPMLMSHVEDIKRQLKEIEVGINDFQLEVEVNSIKGRR